jgi:superfamily II DNA or RNA helicase
MSASVHITLFNQWLVLTVPKGDNGAVLFALEKFISYNETLENWERKTGVKFDINKSEHRVDLATSKFTPTAYANYLSFLETGQYRSLQTKAYFSIGFQSDGNVPLARVDRKTMQLAYRVGLLEQVLKILRLEKFTSRFGAVAVTLTDERENLINWTAEPVYTVGDFELREKDQRVVLDSIRKTMQDDRGKLFHTVLVDLAVGFGKTILMGALVRNIMDYNVVFFFRERNLCLQAINDYLEMGFDVGTIVAEERQVDRYLKEIGQERRPKHGVITGFTIVMIQTLQTRVRSGELTPEDFLGVNGVFVDECEEGYTGEQTQKLFDLFRAGIQVGYSGTPLDSAHKKQRLLTLSLFGSQIYKITVAQNNANGVTLPANVRFYYHGLAEHLTKTKDGNWRAIGSVKDAAIYYSAQRYQKMKTALLRALKQGKQAMIYFGHAPLEIGEFLYTQMTKDSDLMHYGMGFITGDVPVDERSRMYQEFSKANLRVLVANRVVRRGLNVPEIQVIVNWEVTDNKASIIQAIIGRPCRRNGTDESFEVIDFFDHGHPEIDQLSLGRVTVLTSKDIGAKVTYDYPNNNGEPL